MNGFTIVALVALLAAALGGRTWLGLTGPGQLDPVALILSCLTAVVGLSFALPTAREQLAEPRVR
ncbi:MAG: hypothetical protein AAF721_11620 [Myxococcota bacterium]